MGEIVSGTITSIRGPFRNRWSILSVRSQAGTVAVTGCLPSNIGVGDSCDFEGSWTQHAQYGDQFAAESMKIVVPKDRQGQMNYLARRLSGVGPKMAKLLIETFGGLDAVIEVIEQRPYELKKIPGLTDDRIETIRRDWQQAAAFQEFDLFCATHGITPRLGERLLEVYRKPQVVISVIKSNPYVLAEEVWGVGFVKADQIAAYVGIPRDSAFRIEAGVRYTLQEAASAGHCFLTQAELMLQATKLLNINEPTIAAHIERVVASGKIDTEDDRLYHGDLLECEKEVAGKLRTLLRHPLPRVACDLTSEGVAEMDASQRCAVAFALTEKVLVITGGPGVGKTYTVNKILGAFGRGYRIELAAPTGKAAKRMIEATGRDARTIHRLLEYSPQEGGFIRNHHYPLDCDLVVIDEISMVDIRLMAALLDAIPPSGCQLLMVGDRNQLPSVGPGKVLSDMIFSGEIPVVELTELHRQAAGSLININAQRINRGEPLLTRLEGIEPDFWILPEENKENIPAQIIKLCQKIPEQFKVSLSDIQVLCPQRVGPIGTEKLNPILRDEVFNPYGASIYGTIFRKNDKVIQLKNVYTTGIFNGDIGTILEPIDEKYIAVEFESVGASDKGFIVEYPRSALDELSLAYALTIHKSQGSEFPVVIMPVHTANYMMLQRTLLYTGITRAKTMVVLVGTDKAILQAIRNATTQERNTTLRSRIRTGG